MPRKKTQAKSPSQYGREVEAALDGRGRNAAFTSGARTAQPLGKDADGKNVKRGEGMRQAWDSNANVATYTSSRSGKLSTNGRTAGGETWTMTQKDDDGNTIRQSGRNKMASRRQRYYDVRVGLGMAGG